MTAAVFVGYCTGSRGRIDLRRLGQAPQQTASLCAADMQN
jgi:hypothetical protein